MTRQEILDAIHIEEKLLDFATDINETDRFQISMRISALYDQLAELDNAQYILEHPESLSDAEEELAAAAMKGMTLQEYRKYQDNRDNAANDINWWEAEGFNYNPLD